MRHEFYRPVRDGREPHSSWQVGTLTWLWPRTGLSAPRHDVPRSGIMPVATLQLLLFAAPCDRHRMTDDYRSALVDTEQQTRHGQSS
jgi:hypothetical protein